jgi:Na+/proline symporter
MKNIQTSKQIKTNGFLLIAVALLVAAGIGVASIFYVTDHTVLTPGEQHASNSPFSPLINENNGNPNADTVLQPGK